MTTLDPSHRIDRNDLELEIKHITATGNAAIAGTLAVTGATTQTGAFTPTGGVAAAGGFSALRGLSHTGGVCAMAAADGTDATPSVTETYLAAMNCFMNFTATGIAVFNGSAKGSGNVKVYLADSAGLQLAASASTAISGTDDYQLVPFTATYAIKGPATYLVLTQYDNTASRFNTHVRGAFPAGKLTSTTYGTFPTVTVPTTFTTGLGPIASIY